MNCGTVTVTGDGGNGGENGDGSGMSREMKLAILGGLAAAAVFYGDALS